ncbi:hypothetical protein ACELLULO517_05595 [Acidisoma cellulosilytica]|uniref:Uncharacterized protein n=1 Tax=Acidisoma cellulosilyticum TaxID=2802395 RepID=A0A963Z0P4_9PROT|nr:hypothetical protein [Acidisoma cellulosilyticum]MCB8879698.1 hypothetical protein [Acidisoma cellulosilyticum]
MGLAATATASASLRLKSIGRMPLPLLGAAFLLLLFLRHPGGILHATFWAEDGWNWYPDAYTLGIRCLVVPHTGYLQTFSRLGGLAVQPMPLLWAPTVFAGLALIVQVLPPLLLLSRRFDAAWPNYWSRLVFAIVYLGLPDSFETFGNLTNSQWYLAILAFLVVVSTRPRGLAGFVADGLALILSGLSGPLCLMLAPIAVWSWWQDRRAGRLLRLGLVLAAACAQLTALLLSLAQRHPTLRLGASLINLAHILTAKLVYGLFLGSRVMVRLDHSAFWGRDSLALAIAAALTILIGLAWWRGGSLFRRFALFGGLVFAAALVSPVVSGASAWAALASPGSGDRYFLIPMLVVAAACFSLAADRQRWISRGGFGLCLALGGGVCGDFPYPHMRQTDFDSRARAFAAAPSGTSMTFPVLPVLAATMVLVKK